MLLGPTMDPKVASKISLRIPHLSIRMAAHGERALAMAERLHDGGVNVGYPGLAHHPDRALFDELRCPDHGYGGVLTIDMGDQETANRLMALLQNKYRFGFMAVSLGYFDTLMSCSGSSTSSELTEDDKSEAGISPGLVRMSIGYTGTLEQRWQQLKDALEEIGAPIAYAKAG
jgi:methionine-gamma-lyase